jgi:putative transposase
VQEKPGGQPVPVSGVCRGLGMSRQNYYARRQARQRQVVAGELVAALVRQERHVQPRIGGRKLRRVLQPMLAEAGVKIGRDRLFAELRQRGLLVPALPRPWPQTTRHNPSLPVFHNAIKGLEVRRANEVWVADLTYVRTDEGFLYVSLITDKYSRKIVGYHAAETLATQGPLKALEMALAKLPRGAKPIHHSDRGCQYCSHEYVARLKDQALSISMTEEDHCAQNALAERVNGILKQEYGLGYGFKSKALGRKTLAESIGLYNTRRLHTALNYQVPEAVHRRGTIENK